MHPFSLTLSYATEAELVAAVMRLSTPAPVALLAFADRPDVGAPESLAASVPTPPAAGNPFLAGPPMGAPFGAGVAVPPTAPAGAPATSPQPATVFAPLVSTAPVAAAPTAPVDLTTPVLDAQGLPWDGRIHASTKALNKTDGTWRQKRELDPAVKLQIEAQLRQAMGAVAPPPAAPAPIAPPAASAAPVVPLPPAAPPVAAPTAPASTGETFGQLMARLGPIYASGDAARIGKINEALAAFKLSALAQLAARSDLVTPFAQTVDAMLAA